MGLANIVQSLFRTVQSLSSIVQLLSNILQLLSRVVHSLFSIHKRSTLVLCACLSIVQFLLLCSSRGRLWGCNSWSKQNRYWFHLCVWFLFLQTLNPKWNHDFRFKVGLSSCYQLAAYFPFSFITRMSLLCYLWKYCISRLVLL